MLFETKGTESRMHKRQELKQLLESPFHIGAKTVQTLPSLETLTLNTWSPVKTANTLFRFLIL